MNSITNEGIDQWNNHLHVESKTEQNCEIRSLNKLIKAYKGANIRFADDFFVLPAQNAFDFKLHNAKFTLVF